MILVFLGDDWHQRLVEKVIVCLVTMHRPSTGRQLGQQRGRPSAPAGGRIVKEPIIHTLYVRVNNYIARSATVQLTLRVRFFLTS